MADITYKHIEITSRPSDSNIIEGKCCFFVGNRMLNVTHISDSEAECLVQINKQVKELVQKLNSFA